jgi:hypothetical protein
MSEWIMNSEGEEIIEGLDCRIWLAPRPPYCDRGVVLAHIEYKLNADRIRLWLDGADGWPRYYMNRDRCKLECEDWLKRRGQWL